MDNYLFIYLSIQFKFFLSIYQATQFDFLQVTCVMSIDFFLLLYIEYIISKLSMYKYSMYKNYYFFFFEHVNQIYKIIVQCAWFIFCLFIFI